MEDFTTEPLKYTIPAKDFDKIINDLRDHVDLLYQRCDQQLGRIKYLEDRVFEGEIH